MMEMMMYVRERQSIYYWVVHSYICDSVLQVLLFEYTECEIETIFKS